MKTEGNWTVWCKSKTNPTEVVPQDFRNFGQKSLSEIEQMLIDRGLSFGMDLNRLNLRD